MNISDQTEQDSPAVKAPLRALRFFYLGEVQPFMRIAVGNMLFAYLSLGAYYFKAMTRIMTYIGRNLALSKQLRFQYDGEPLPFFKAVAPAIGVFAISIGLMQWAVTLQNMPLFFGMMTVVYAALHAGLFLARRYHLQHFSLGPVRATLDLSFRDYMFCVLKRAALNVVTLGYAIPQSDIVRWNLIASHIRVGTQVAASDASAKNLRWIHLVSFYIPFMLIIVFMTMAEQASLPVAEGGQQNAVARSFLMILLYVTLACGFVGRVWYRAALREECLRTLSIAGVSFKTSITGTDLLKNRLLNSAVTLATFGLGFPFMLHRNLKLWAKNDGDIRSRGAPDQAEGVSSLNGWAL